MGANPRTASIAATVVLHVAAGAALLQLDAVRKPLIEALPLMVNLITPPKPEPPRVEPPKPRPAPVQPQRIEPQPVLTVDSTAPSPVAVAPQPRPAPVPQPIDTPVAPVASAPPPPAPVVPPSFDAAYLQNPPPAYPPLSKRRGEKGRVVLRVFVSREGTAQQVELRTSSGFEQLDQAAMAAVRQWRFVPAKQGDQAVAAWVLVPILFALER
jgi:protein TonB